MRRLFLCERPYPLYKTLLRSMNSIGENDIFLSNHINGMEKMYEPLKNSGIFKNVYFFDDVLYKKFNGSFYMTSNEHIIDNPKLILSYIKQFIGYIKLEKQSRHITIPEGLDLENYDEIYVNDATSTFAFYIYSKKKHVIYVEHATNVFQGSTQSLHRKLQYLLGLLDKLHLIYSLGGTSRFVDTVEVNQNKNLFSYIRKKNILEVSLNDLINSLNPEQKEKIFQLYCEGYGINFSKSCTYNILLTSPLFVDGYVKSSHQQNKIYRSIIENHLSDSDFIIIKPHPRDTFNYENFVDNIILIPNVFSSEILSLGQNINIHKVVTTHSSSIRIFKNADECIDLGRQYVKDFVSQYV